MFSSSFLQILQFTKFLGRSQSAPYEWKDKAWIYWEEIILWGQHGYICSWFISFSRGNRGLGKKIYADSCHFSS